MHRPPAFHYTRPTDLDLAAPRRVPLVIVGAGLVGLTLALDLAQRGVASIVLEARDATGEGSRAIVFAQRSIEILARLGLREPLLSKGVDWRTGRVFYQGREAYSFDFRTEDGYSCPPFVNIQQSYIEAWLTERCLASGLVEIRSQNAVTAVAHTEHGAQLALRCPDGDYTLNTHWLVACDGARSFVRSALELPFVGRMFHDRFLIVDVEMDPGFSAERRFWFDPPFHPDKSVLLHKQPDSLWRVDFQLGPDADLAQEREPERVAQRLRQMLGPDIAFRIDWISIYSFRCRRLARFVHQRVIFAGDSAHEVSPFGGRGGNGGIQDADNLGWKLAAVLRYGADPALLQSYDEERVYAADENILNSTRSACFITPESPAVKVLREAVLLLAGQTALGRSLVNSGRLSRPANLHATSQFRAQHGSITPGTPAPDAPVLNHGQPDWLINHIGRTGFSVLGYELTGAQWASVRRDSAWPLDLISVGTSSGLHSDVTHLVDVENKVAARYQLQPGHVVLLRPDQHVLATLSVLDVPTLNRLINRAMQLYTETQPLEATS